MHFSNFCVEFNIFHVNTIQLVRIDELSELFQWDFIEIHFWQRVFQPWIKRLF